MTWVAAGRGDTVDPARELFEPGRSNDSATQLALGLCVAYNVAATVANLAAGRWNDRRGSVRVPVSGATFFGAADCWFATGPSGVLALAPAFVSPSSASVAQKQRSTRR